VLQGRERDVTLSCHAQKNQTPRLPTFRESHAHRLSSERKFPGLKVPVQTHMNEIAAEVDDARRVIDEGINSTSC
jgi:hypothetical protein